MRGGGTVVQVAAFSCAGMEEKNDWKYVAYPEWLQICSSYCHCEEARNGGRDCRPLHSSWLRICHHDDAEGPRMASGGYVRHVISSYLLCLNIRKAKYLSWLRILMSQSRLSSRVLQFGYSQGIPKSLDTFSSLY